MKGGIFMPFENLYLGDELRKEVDSLKKVSFMVWCYYNTKLKDYERFCRETDEILTFGEFIQMS